MTTCQCGNLIDLPDADRCRKCRRSMRIKKRAASISPRVSVELLERLRAVAAQERRSLSNLIVILLEDALAAREKAVR